MKEKNFYLHVGCGKTGSSALQLWLRDNRRKLLKYGFYYPDENDKSRKFLSLNLFRDKNKNSYEITSGNGSHYFQMIKNGDYSSIENMMDGENHIILSSESFQGLNEKELENLRTIIESKGYTPHIIVYIRDVYDVLYSSYSQAVKRHLASESFYEFIERSKSVQEIEVLKKYEKFFQNIHLLHYDTEKTQGLERSFCRTLSLDPSAIPSMEKRKVNRSLTIFELNLMRVLNRVYKKFYHESMFGLSKFSQTISDALIYNAPEKENEIFVDYELIDILNKRFSKDIDRINRKYFTDNRLKIFDPSGKNTVDEVTDIDSEYTISIESALNFILSISDNINNRADSSKEKDLVKRLIREADKIKSSSSEDAYILLKAAKILRPGGKLISKKLSEYYKEGKGEE